MQFRNEGNGPPCSTAGPGTYCLKRYRDLAAASTRVAGENGFADTGSQGLHHLEDYGSGLLDRGERLGQVIRRDPTSGGKRFCH